MNIITFSLHEFMQDFKMRSFIPGFYIMLLSCGYTDEKANITVYVTRRRAKLIVNLYFAVSMNNGVEFC
jgi:hypothetical protein